MRSEDITYCNRNCENYKCKRNIAHLPETNYAFYGVFDNCEEYIGNIEDETPKT